MCLEVSLTYYCGNILYLMKSHFKFYIHIYIYISIACMLSGVWLYQFSSIAQSCPSLCDPMDCSTPGLPVYHQLPEFAPTHVHWVGDAIQPSHPLLSSPLLPAFNLSHNQGLFQRVDSSSCGQSIGASASVLPIHIRDWFPLVLTGLISFLSKGLSRVFSNTTVQKQQFPPTV